MAHVLHVFHNKPVSYVTVLNAVHMILYLFATKYDKTIILLYNRLDTVLFVQFFFFLRVLVKSRKPPKLIYQSKYLTT